MPFGCQESSTVLPYSTRSGLDTYVADRAVTTPVCVYLPRIWSLWTEPTRDSYCTLQHAMIDRSDSSEATVADERRRSEVGASRCCPSSPNEGGTGNEARRRQQSPETVEQRRGACRTPWPRPRVNREPARRRVARAGLGQSPCPMAELRRRRTSLYLHTTDAKSLVAHEHGQQGGERASREVWREISRKTRNLRRWGCLLARAGKGSVGQSWSQVRSLVDAQEATPGRDNAGD